jgi:hypothetical protein
MKWSYIPGLRVAKMGAISFSCPLPASQTRTAGSRRRQSPRPPDRTQSRCRHHQAGMKGELLARRPSTARHSPRPPGPTPSIAMKNPGAPPHEDGSASETPATTAGATTSKSEIDVIDETKTEQPGSGAVSKSATSAVARARHCDGSLPSGRWGWAQSSCWLPY